MSRDASYLQINGFDGVFRLEAVSLEGPRDGGRRYLRPVEWR